MTPTHLRGSSTIYARGLNDSPSEAVCVTEHSTTSCSLLNEDIKVIFDIVSDMDRVAGKTWEAATMGSQMLKRISIVVFEVQPVTETLASRRGASRHVVAMLSPMLASSLEAKTTIRTKGIKRTHADGDLEHASQEHLISTQ